MSILDDAIREHLELKRAHGADEGELKRLEDEAFGPPQRPDEIDPFAEAPTEFLVSPGEGAADTPEIADEHARSGRRPNITDLQEAPPEGAPGPSPADPAQFPPPADAPEGTAAPMEDELAPPADAPPPTPADAADVPLPPPPTGEAAANLAPPTGEEPVADLAPAGGEPHDADEAPAPAAPDLAADHGPDTEERHVIADQPTQMFDVQAEMEAEAAAPEAPVDQPSPTDEELVDAVQDEPRAAPPVPDAADAQAELPVQPLESRGPDAEVAGHPPTEAEPEEESAEFDFFNEQRLSDELDRALDAPIADEGELPDYGDAAPGQGAIFDFESQGAYEEDPSEEVLRRADERDAAEAEPPSEEVPHAEEPPSEEAPLDATVEQPRPNVDPPSGETEPPSEEAPGAPRDAATPPVEDDDYDYDPETGHDDVLEDTPRFLEDQPEDDDLWFEQRPPKDFDLD